MKSGNYGSDYAGSGKNDNNYGGNNADSLYLSSDAEALCKGDYVGSGKRIDMCA